MIACEMDEILYTMQNTEIDIAKIGKDQHTKIDRVAN